MKVLAWQDFLANVPHAMMAATVGVFDGLHRGHQALIETVRKEAPQLKPCVITFRENPKKILHPASYRGSLLTTDQKLSAIEALGIEYCVLIDFSGKFATLSGREFIAALYVANVRFVAVGENFQFGYKLDTDAAKLKALSEELGLRSAIVKNVMYRGHPVSSSRIRHAVQEGRLEEAADMLGRPYQIIVRQGTEPGVMTAEDDLLLPPNGEYEGIANDGQAMQNCRVEIDHRNVKFGLRMQSEVVRFAFVDTATQEKENLVWL